jgi:hypothetical protein
MKKQSDSKPTLKQAALDLDYTQSLADMIERLPEGGKNSGKHYLRTLLEKEGSESVMTLLGQAVDSDGKPRKLNKYSFSNSQRALLKGVGLSWPRSGGRSDESFNTPYAFVSGVASLYNGAKVATGSAPILSEESAWALGLGTISGVLISEQLLRARIATVATSIDDYIALSHNSGRQAG